MSIGSPETLQARQLLNAPPVAFQISSEVAFVPAHARLFVLAFFAPFSPSRRVQ
jgi:hypothetical protein